MLGRGRPVDEVRRQYRNVTEECKTADLPTSSIHFECRCWNPFVGNLRLYSVHSDIFKRPNFQSVLFYCLLREIFSYVVLLG
jgi:alpha-glucosidase (family GH31 glycosyl hydrolase)